MNCPRWWGGALSTAMLLAIVAAPAISQQIPTSMFPKSNDVPGWTLTSGPVAFADKQLFNYMDGAAEIPKSYRFRTLASAKYRKGGTVLEVAIFDMTAAADAFGYYSARVFLERSPRSKERTVRLEHPAHIYSNVGVMTFWKDRYTVILQPDDGKPDDESLLRFAKYVSAHISATGSEPDMLRRLPAAGQSAVGTVYSGKAAFDATVMFTARDLFGLAKGPEAVAAEYGESGKELTLAIIKYSSASAAADAVSAVRRFMVESHYKAEATTVTGAFVCVTPGRAKGIGVAARGTYVLLAAGAANASAVNAGLHKLEVGMRN